MRDPTANTDAAEKKHVDDAIKEARKLLIKIQVVRWHDPDRLKERPNEFSDARALIVNIVLDKDITKLLGEPLALLVRDVAVPALMRGRPPPHRQQAGQPAKSFRDRMIAETVNQICQRRFNPTRNPGTKSKSASWIVSRALSKNGVKLSEARVAAIWAKYNRQA